MSAISEYYMSKISECSPIPCKSLKDFELNSIGAMSVISSNGYDLSGVSDFNLGRYSGVLLALLSEIVFVADEREPYFMTMSEEYLSELYHNSNLIPDAGENGLPEIQKLITGLNESEIVKNLEAGKFKYVKLVPSVKCSTNFFMCKVRRPNSYSIPDEDMLAKMYPVTALYRASKYVYDSSIDSYLELLMKDGSKLEVHNFILQTKKVIPTSNLIILHNQENNPTEVKITNIESCTKVFENEWLRRLHDGVVEYKGSLVTLSTEILERYYGVKLLYSGNLESLGSRLRRCYQEVLVSEDVNVREIINKYNLDLVSKNEFDLMRELRQRMKSAKNAKNDYISARVLIAPSQILTGHKSFYKTIKIDDLTDENCKEVDTEDILPKIYTYYGISYGYGYMKCNIEAYSVDLALKNGKKEFERQFGEHEKFCSLVLKGKVIKGLPPLDMNCDAQMRINSALLWGYKDGFGMYSKYIRIIAKANNIDISMVSDDIIMYLFANEVAKKFPRCGEIKLKDCAIELVKFFTMLLTSERSDLDVKLNKCWCEIALKRAQKEYKSYKDTGVDLKEFAEDDRIVGKDGIFYIDSKGSLTNKCDLKYRGEIIKHNVILKVEL